jgi:hypothetical protein
VEKILEVNNNGSFFKRLMPYNQPGYLVFIGFIFSCLAGSIFPSFGIYISKSIFHMMIPDKEIMWKEANKWNMAMGIAALSAFVVYFCS